MHELFRSAAALEDAAEVRRQIRAGVLCRVRIVQEVLGAGAMDQHQVASELFTKALVGAVKPSVNTSAGGGAGHQALYRPTAAGAARGSRADEKEDGLVLPGENMTEHDP